MQLKGTSLNNYVHSGDTFEYDMALTAISGNESGNSIEDSALPPDLTDDDRVDMDDLARAAAVWLTTYGLNDLSVIAENWLVY